MRSKSGKPKVAAPKKKAGGRKSPVRRGPDLEVVEVRYHPAPDASSRLRNAYSLILQAAGDDPPDGEQEENADGFKGADDGHLKGQFSQEDGTLR